MTAAELMSQLCRSFPLLSEADGVEPWDPREFARWASQEVSGAQRQAAGFVLAVWHGGTPDDGGWWSRANHSVGAFDPVRAWLSWGSEDREAFLAWCRNPFWP